MRAPQALAPERGEVANNLGWSLLLRGRWDEALAELEQAAALDRKSPRIANNLELARVALKDGLPQRGQGESDETWSARLNDAGVAAAARGERGRAIAAFAQAIETRSNGTAAPPTISPRSRPRDESRHCCAAVAGDAVRRAAGAGGARGCLAPSDFQLDLRGDHRRRVRRGRPGRAGRRLWQNVAVFAGLLAVGTPCSLMARWAAGTSNCSPRPACGSTLPAPAG